MSNEQQELLNEIYKVFYENELSIKTAYEDGDMLGSQPHIDKMFSNPDELIILTKEQFINKIKTDDEFTKECGLKFEERGLSLDERNQWFHINWNGRNPLGKSDWKDYELNQQNVPTKLITITYNNETIESYE